MRLLFIILGLLLLCVSTVNAVQFNVYYDPADEDFVRHIKPVVRSEYERISNDIGFYPKKEIEIYICRTQEEFDRLYGGKPAKEIIGFASVDPQPIIVLKSPIIAPRSNFKDTLEHELSHIILLQLFDGKEIPRWLNEGFSMYESGELRINHYMVVASAALRGDLLPLNQLDYAFYGRGAKLDLAYAQSYYLMKYIVNTYGPDKFREFILGFAQSLDLSEAIERTFNIDYETFEKNWRASIKERYYLASLLAYSSPVWIMILLGFLVYAVKKYRARKIIEKWDQEELENPFFRGRIDRQ